LALTGWRAGAALALAFGLGFAVRGAFAPELRTSGATATLTATPTATATATATATPAATPPATAIATASVDSLPNAPSVSSSSPDNRSLAAERALLDVARTALANGDPDRALQATLRHERSYPSGALVEEREAIAIKALVAAGRKDEARARGARFLERFPSGLMRPAVEGALRSIAP
jgi:hypothetical protein